MTTALKTWKDYLHLDNLTETAANCRKVCSRTFESERERLLRVWRRLQPGSVACLGAGCLNDIPVREFLERGTQVTLVDWVPGIVQAGLAREIVRGPAESPVCVCCHMLNDQAGQICANYCPYPQPRDLCRSFRLSRGPGCLCDNYCPNGSPRVLEGDVSGGIGQRFAENVFTCLNRSRNPSIALRRLRATLESIEKKKVHLPFLSASFDLVISAMVLSQFDHEPLQYLASSLQARYSGVSISEQERRLQNLRRRLFQAMLAGHLEEIKRLLKPGGRVYLTFEVLHRSKNSRTWFIPDYVAPVLQKISQQFLCSDEAFDPGESLSRTEMPGGESIVQSFLLVAA